MKARPIDKKRISSIIKMLLASGLINKKEANKIIERFNERRAIRL